MMVHLTLKNLPEGHCCTFAKGDFRSAFFGPPHVHDFHEFFWVEEGEGFHHINGEKIPLRPGDLILVRADDSHTFSATTEGGYVRIVNFAFLARIWNDCRRRYFDGEEVFFSLRPLAARSYELEEAQLAEIQMAARHLRAGARGRLHVESFLLTVLTLLREGRPWTVGDRPVPRWIAQACVRIGEERNFAGGMPALSRLAGRSPEHVAREFRRHLDRTPTEVINEARMSHAANRLATTEDKVIDISLDCGLENLGHFYRLFQARYGCTPRRYRMQQRGVPFPGLAGGGRIR